MIFAQCMSEFSSSYGLTISLFLAGLVGGFTHCSGMCAPFVLPQLGDGKLSLKRLNSIFLLPYHLGRITTYVAMALVLGTFINFAYIFSPTKALISVPILMLAGVLFLVSAFPKLGMVFPWAVRVQIAKPFAFLTGFISKLTQSQNMVGRYSLGVLLGFMPCGMVISALLAAGTAGSAIGSGLAMFAFAVGTVPALVLVALGGQAARYKYPKIQTRLSQVAMVVSSMWLFILAGTMIF